MEGRKGARGETPGGIREGLTPTCPHPSLPFFPFPQPHSSKPPSSYLPTSPFSAASSLPPPPPVAPSSPPTAPSFPAPPTSMLWSSSSVNLSNRHGGREGGREGGRKCRWRRRRVGGRRGWIAAAAVAAVAAAAAIVAAGQLPSGSEGRVSISLDHPLPPLQPPLTHRLSWSTGGPLSIRPCTRRPSLPPHPPPLLSSPSSPPCI